MKTYSSAFRSMAAAVALTATAALSAQQAKYIFYCIGDGMGIPEVTNTQIYKEAVLQEGPLTMTTFPVVSMATTHSWSSRVTDSAASGTALATGVKTRNSMLGMGPDTVAVTSIAKYLHDDGYGVGIVTSVAIDDATPGAFYSHVPNRKHFYDTGRFLAESGYEFFAGSALRGTKNADGSDNGLVDYIRQSGVTINYGLDGLDTTAERMLILSPEINIGHDNSIGYTIDSIAGAVTLPQLTEAALAQMQRVSPNRFFMMIEGGNIDHAGHANDGGTLLREVINFDQAIAIAYNFYLAHPDETLIVVTADHETGGMSVGCAATGYSAPVSMVAAQKVSKEMFNLYCQQLLASDKPVTWPEMEKYLKDNFGFWEAVKMNPDETESLHTLFDQVFTKGDDTGGTNTMYASFNAFSNRVFDILNYKAGFGWTTPHHTGSPVPVYAIGVGAEKFSSFNDNALIPAKIFQIATGRQLP